MIALTFLVEQLARNAAITLIGLAAAAAFLGGTLKRRGFTPWARSAIYALIGGACASASFLSREPHMLAAALIFVFTALVGFLLCLPIASLGSRRPTT